MRVPFWLLRLLPMWEYICPKCRKTVKKSSHECPHCGERFPLAIRVPPSFLKNPKKLEEYVHKHVFPEISPIHRLYLTQYFTELLNNQFEEGDFSAWTGIGEYSASASVGSTDPHHGTYHGTFTADGVNWHEYAYCYKNLTGQTILYARCYFKETTAFPSSWGPRHTVIAFHNQSTDIIAEYGILSYGDLYWYVGYLSGDDWNIENDGLKTLADVTTDTWYCMEAYAKIDGSNGAYAFFIDGEEVLSIDGLDTDNRGNIDQVRIGLPESNSLVAHTHRVDCVVVADAYIGPEEEVTLKTVTDSFSLSESVLRDKTLILTDSLGLADSLYGNKSLLLSDSASLSELVTVIIGEVMKYVTDSVNIVDLAYALKTLKTSDSLTLVDATSTPSRVLKALDAIGATDNAAVNKVLQITETVSLAEIVEVGVGNAKKTRLFLIIGDLAVQLTGD